jgi:two-component system, OmpR family, sensor histidine kinase KdpD
MRFAEDLGAEPIRVQGSDVARALMEVAHDKNVGSIVIGHSRHGRLHELLRGSIVHRLMRLAGEVDVHVVSDRERNRATRGRHAPLLSCRLVPRGPPTHTKDRRARIALTRTTLARGRQQ